MNQAFGKALDPVFQWGPLGSLRAALALVSTVTGQPVHGPIAAAEGNLADGVCRLVASLDVQPGTQKWRLRPNGGPSVAPKLPVNVRQLLGMPFTASNGGSVGVTAHFASWYGWQARRIALYARHVRSLS